MLANEKNTRDGRCRPIGALRRSELYSKRMNLAQLPTANGTRSVQLDISCAGESHASVHLHSGSPGRDPPRPLSPSASARAAEDGSLVAQEPRLHSRGHRPPGRRLPPQCPALPRRVRRRRRGPTPTLALEGSAQRTRRSPSFPGRLLRGTPAALRVRSPGGHRATNRRPAGPDPGPRLLKKLSACAGARSGPSRPRPTPRSKRNSFGPSSARG